MLYRARTGVKLQIRRIAAIDALEELVGRCAETGKSIIASPGVSGLRNIMVIAGMSVLTYVHRLAARHGVTMTTILAGADAYLVMEENVREAYMLEGKTDEYSSDLVQFIGGGAASGGGNISFAGAVIGMISREKPGGSIMIGSWAAEALVILENAYISGAMQVGGTASIYQLPFFIAASDFVVIGEELYAAGAYLSQDQEQIASIVGQDLGRVLVVGLIILGGVLASTGMSSWLLNLLTM
jgi:hypothetical protein